MSVGQPSTRVLRAKFDQILPHFDERRRRLYLASEATAIGHGGITRVAAASGTSTATIARGIAELAGCSAPILRIRAPGAGRKRLRDIDPGLLPTLESLIEPHTRGDPISPLRDSVSDMKIERVASRISVTTLTALAGLHVAWGLGSPWPLPDRETYSDAVIGRPNPPGPMACFAVAGALGTAALLVAGRPQRRPALSRLGAAGVAGVLGMRGVAGLVGRTDLLSPGSSSARFRRLDRLAYSPLCLALAASTAVSTAARRSR